MDKMEAINIILNSLRNILADFLAHLPQIVAGVTILFATWVVTKIVQKLWGKIFGRFNLRRSLKELFLKFTYIALWLFGVVIAAMIIFPDLTPGRLLTVIGLGSVALGFAFKDIFENFMAGILILIREPFQIGDYIECEDLEGQIEEITIRDTHIRQTDGQRVVLPNAMLFKEPVTVRTDLDRRRASIVCGVAYGEDVDEARAVIYNSLKDLETVDQSKPIQVLAQEFSSSSIDFEVRWWTGSKPGEIKASKDKVIAGVKRALDDSGIEIPFPYRTLTFKGPIEAVVNENRQNGNKRERKKSNDVIKVAEKS